MRKLSPETAAHFEFSPELAKRTEALPEFFRQKMTEFLNQRQEASGKLVPVDSMESRLDTLEIAYLAAKTLKTKEAINDWVSQDLREQEKMVPGFLNGRSTIRTDIASRIAIEFLESTGKS